MITANKTITPASLRPVGMELFPSMTSLEEVVAYAKAQLPIKDENTLLTILFTYHNTLLYVKEHQHGS